MALAQIRSELIARASSNGYLSIEDIEAVFAANANPTRRDCRPTHRHKKRGSEYILLGFGKMQAGRWFDLLTHNGVLEAKTSVDMCEVAIYRGEDGQHWVRPREEFEDGRFEALPGGSDDAKNCPIRALTLKTGDTCATDIELGTCHAECLEGSPTVNLDTGEPVDGPIPTYPYEPDRAISEDGRGWLFDMLARFPLGMHCTIEHDGFAGTVCGYYCRDDGKLGVNLQLDDAKVVHVYGEKWLEASHV
jgi:hypothetical protein